MFCWQQLFLINLSSVWWIFYPSMTRIIQRSLSVQWRPSSAIYLFYISILLSIHISLCVRHLNCISFYTTASSMDPFVGIYAGRFFCVFVVEFIFAHPPSLQSVTSSHEGCCSPCTPSPGHSINLNIFFPKNCQRSLKVEVFCARHILPPHPCTLVKRANGKNWAKNLINKISSASSQI